MSAMRLLRPWIARCDPSCQVDRRLSVRCIGDVFSWIRMQWPEINRRWSTMRPRVHGPVPRTRAIDRSDYAGMLVKPIGECRHSHTVLFSRVCPSFPYPSIRMCIVIEADAETARQEFERSPAMSTFKPVVNLMCNRRCRPSRIIPVNFGLNDDPYRSANAAEKSFAALSEG